MGKEIQRESTYIHVCEENGFSNNVMYSFPEWRQQWLRKG